MGHDDHSNIDVAANVMIDDEQHRPEHRWLPGDLIGVLFPTWVDSRKIDKKLNLRQRREFRETLRCAICGHACAGTCE